jgi:hypothetical protein
MPHTKKKQRVTGSDANYLVVAAATDHLNQVVLSASANDLSVDIMANIFGFLRGIMRQRRVCKKWKEAVKMTLFL